MPRDTSQAPTVVPAITSVRQVADRDLARAADALTYKLTLMAARGLPADAPEADAAWRRLLTAARDHDDAAVAAALRATPQPAHAVETAVDALAVRRAAFAQRQAKDATTRREAADALRGQASMVALMEDTSRALRRRREALGLSQAQVAARCGMKQQAISDAETAPARGHGMSLPTYLAICRPLGGSGLPRFPDHTTTQGETS